MNSKYLDKTDDILKDEMLSRIDRDIRKHSGTFINDSLGPVSIKMAEMYMDMHFIKEKLYIENLEGEELDKKIADQTGEIIRRKATNAHGILTVEGKDGIKLEKGTIVSNGITQYQLLDNVKIGDSGVVDVEIECLESGSIGNTNSNTVNELSNTLPGIDQVYNIEKITGGYDEEDDHSFRERYYEYIRKPATSGNTFHYIQWAKSIPGVGDAKIVPIWDGDNTVKVIIVDYNFKPADAELVERVQEYIDPNKSGEGRGVAPIGAYCTVVPATPKEIDLKVDINIELGYTLGDVKNNVLENINKYFKNISFQSNTISYAKIGAHILYSNGVSDYKNLKINNNINNIYLEDEEAPVLRDVDINEF